MKLHGVLLSAGSLYFPLAGPNISFQLLKVTDKIILTYFLIFRFRAPTRRRKIPYRTLASIPRFQSAFSFFLPKPNFEFLP